ncbi:MAG: translation initiation factor IF-3 [Candidatus Carsonella ruddii]
MKKKFFINITKINVLILTINYKLLIFNIFFKKNSIFLIIFFNKKNFFLMFKNNKKKKIIKKKSKVGRLKEIKINLNIHIKDFNLKIKKTKFFLSEGYTVKISIILKGREIIFKEKGIELLLNIQNNIKETFYKFSNIEFEGRIIFLIIKPNKHNENKKKNY